MSETRDTYDAAFPEFPSINAPEDHAQLDPKLKALLGYRILAGPAEDLDDSTQEMTPHQLIAGYPGRDKAFFRDLMAAEKASLTRALAQSAAGQTEDLGDFTQYVV